jgi:hypothetical protein
MLGDTCDICGRKIEPETRTLHRIVPKSTIQGAELPDPGIVPLCLDCGNGLHSWYRDRVSDSTYDKRIKHFRPKSPDEMVKEYETAYQAYVKYKR